MGGVRKAHWAWRVGANRAPQGGGARRALAWVRPDPARPRPADAGQATVTALRPSEATDTRSESRAVPPAPRPPTSPQPPLRASRHPIHRGAAGVARGDTRPHPSLTPRRHPSLTPEMHETHVLAASPELQPPLNPTTRRKKLI